MSDYVEVFHILACGMLSAALFILFWLTSGFDGYHMYHLNLYITCGVYWMLTVATVMICIRGSYKKLFYFLCFLNASTNLVISCVMVFLLAEKVFHPDRNIVDLIYLLFFGSILIISAMAVYTIARMVIRFFEVIHKMMEGSRLLFQKSKSFLTVPRFYAIVLGSLVI